VDDKPTACLNSLALWWKANELTSLLPMRIWTFKRELRPPYLPDPKRTVYQKIIVQLSPGYSRLSLFHFKFESESKIVAHYLDSHPTASYDDHLSIKKLALIRQIGITTNRSASMWITGGNRSRKIYYAGVRSVYAGQSGWCWRPLWNKTEMQYRRGTLIFLLCPQRSFWGGGIVIMKIKTIIRREDKPAGKSVHHQW